MLTLRIFAAIVLLTAAVSAAVAQANNSKVTSLYTHSKAPMKLVASR